MLNCFIGKSFEEILFKFKNLTCCSHILEDFEPNVVFATLSNDQKYHLKLTGYCCRTGIANLSYAIL